MAHWLMKSEPGSYSWDELVHDGGTEWDGVRTPAARLHLKAMKPGDEALFYHSGEEKAAVGVMRIARAAAPDPKDSDWVSVRGEPVRGGGEAGAPEGDEGQASPGPDRDDPAVPPLRLARPRRGM